MSLRDERESARALGITSRLFEARYRGTCASSGRSIRPGDIVAVELGIGIVLFSVLAAEARQRLDDRDRDRVAALRRERRQTHEEDLLAASR